MSFQKMYPKAYDKNCVDPYTKTRIILMNGAELKEKLKGLFAKAGKKTVQWTTDTPARTSLRMLMEEVPEETHCSAEYRRSLSAGKTHR